MTTTNGGANWVTSRNHSLFGFYDIYFVNSQTGWAVSYYGAILKTINGGGIVSVSNISYETPDKYMLLQNYPNPFNPTTKIDYNIPSNGKVTLRIFDITGKEVSTLVNQEKTAGYYTVSFDASKLSSGNYIYKLEFKENSIVKILTLVK